MPKFTLVCDHGEDGGSGNLKTVVTFEAEYLYDVLDNVEMFLRGSGYCFEGNLVTISDEEESCGNCENCECENESTNSSSFEKVVTQHMEYLDRRNSCKVCGLPTEVMAGQKCYDVNCPKKC